MKANNIKKPAQIKQLFIALGVMLTSALGAQSQLYDNFEGQKMLSYGERSGVLDSAAKNPAPNKVNGSAKCALYVRNGSKKFANIKMNLDRKLTGVDAYATYLGIPPKLKLKVYTSAPPGTLVEILLGAKNKNNDYPAGTHSQYQAYTTVSNAWEELEFKFSQIPQGSETPADQIDQAVLLFNPNSTTSDTYYFDDLTGPPMSIVDTKNQGSATNATNTQGEKNSADNKKQPAVNNKKDNAASKKETDDKKTNKK